MELEILLMVLIVAAVCMVTAGVIIIILDRKKKEKRTFLVSQLLVISVVTMFIGIIAASGKPIDYSEERNVYQVKAVNVINNSYKVELDNGKVIYTDNVIFGDDNIYMYRCKVKSRTLLGFSVLDTKDLLVVIPDVDGFDNMSKSKQKSILKRYNGWRN